jgi:3-oxoacyl-[acyl-carrier-protein] synthase II
VAIRALITGVGLVSPFGTEPAAFRDALLEGRSGLSPVTAFPVESCRARQAALVRDFDPTHWIPPMKLRRMDDTGKFAVVIARQALADARIELDADGRDDIGVALGTYTAGGQSPNEFLEALWAQGPMGAPALLFNSTVANAPASLAALEHRLRGPNRTITQKASSGLAAVAAAADVVTAGRAAAMVAGGVDAVYSVFYIVHDRFGVLSSDEKGGESSRPFDVMRNGFVMGEGGYGFVVEGVNPHRERAGPAPYAGILGYAAGSEAVPVNAWPRRPESIARVMRSALSDAGLVPGDVDVVYAAANSSPGLDCIEAQAIAAVFGRDATVPVTGVKGSIGEAASSGAGALMAAVLCGGAMLAPPTAGLANPDPCAAGLSLVRGRSTKAGPVALINGISSGGSIGTLVVRATPRGLQEASSTRGV